MKRTLPKDVSENLLQDDFEPEQEDVNILLTMMKNAYKENPVTVFGLEGFDFQVPAEHIAGYRSKGDDYLGDYLFDVSEESAYWDFIADVSGMAAAKLLDGLGIDYRDLNVEVQGQANDLLEWLADDQREDYLTKVLKEQAA